LLTGGQLIDAKIIDRPKPRQHYFVKKEKVFFRPAESRPPPLATMASGMWVDCCCVY
jgi:hypothetical protein